MLKALLISKYDGSQIEPLKTINSVLQRVKFNGLDCEAVLATEGTAASPTSVAKYIAQSPFVVVYISPQEVARTIDGRLELVLTWNPNVFFELGYAASRGIPIFAFANAAARRREAANGSSDRE